MAPVDFGPLDEVASFQLRPTIRGSVEIEGWQHKNYQWCYALFVTSSSIPWAPGKKVRIRGMTSGYQEEIILQRPTNNWGLNHLSTPSYYFPIQVLSQYPKPGGGNVKSPGTYHDSPCRQYFSWSDGEEAVATLMD
uniref:Uncharacterized protein n=1 Tax=Magnetococcus massalia (strain MO-1) TaxID=451514 RepID=A0A1S7LIB3_MAGMO|nr:protein of unknown function [Candidatus Magnetococcus massalia]